MNLMDLFIKIGVDDQASGSINKLTSMSIAKGHLIADAVKKALSIMVDLGKQSIMTYADFEQLEGGIKKLFGEQDMKKVLANADIAYKTAGMSANKYLETTTSFAASLIAGLDGDTAKAAEYADMAIRDMSDNANTFGTDISMIQNAYQGFAKQNYTMLDNLRLGYGGTASEMARLINDSGVLGDTVTVTASNINRVSFDTIVKAINKVQEEMGITGTTMTEAEGTIKGSIEAVKASWENLLTAMINDPDSVGEKFDALAESINTAWGNIKPSISALGQSLENIIDEKFPGLATALDVLVPLVTGLFAGFASYQVVTKAASAFATLKTVLSGGASLASGGVIGLALAAITAYATTMFMVLKSKDAQDAIAGFTGKLVTVNSEMERFNKLYADAQNMNVEKPIVSEEQETLFENKFKEIMKAHGFDVKDDAVTDEQMKALHEALGIPYASKPGENVLLDSDRLGDAIVDTILAGATGNLSLIGGDAPIWVEDQNKSTSGILHYYDTPGTIPAEIYDSNSSNSSDTIDKLRKNGYVVTANISINGLMYKDSEELAEEVVGKIQQMIDGKEAAYD